MVMERLKGHAVFSLLSPREIERLSAASGVMRLKEGETVYTPGVVASHVFVLLKGRVELRRTAPGEAGFLVDDIVDGGMFGVSSLTGLERYILKAECVKDSEVLKIEINALRRILDDNPVVGYAIQQRISQIFFKRYVNAMEMITAGVT